MEWLQKGTHEKHLSVYEYEKKMRKAEVEELEQELGIPVISEAEFLELEVLM